MKTRVIRYWHKTDWLYKVEKHIQSETDQPLFTFVGSQMVRSEKSLKAGEWYWDSVKVGISRDFATSIASRLAYSLPLEDNDIIAEFGDL